MPGKKWTPDEDAKLLDLRANGKTWPDIAAALCRKLHSCMNRYRRVKNPEGYRAKARARYAALPLEKKEAHRATARDWYARCDRVKLRRTKKRYADAHRPELREKSLAYYYANWDRYRAAAANRRLTRRFDVMIEYCRARARRRGSSITLTAKDLESMWSRQEGRCFYTGRQLTMESGQPHTVSVDRINSAMGYEPANVALVCTVVNYMKQEYSVSDFIEWCRAVAAHADRKPALV